MKRLYFVILTVICFSTNSCEKKHNTKKLLKTCIYSDPQTLDTRKGGDYITSQILFMLYRGLMHYSSKGELICSLAKSYTISKDKKNYIFFLKDVNWTDGKPITAYDFEKSWKKILEPSFPSMYSELLYPIKNAEKAKKGEIDINEVKIKAKDAKTLYIELENPNPYFLFLTSFYVYFPMPSHITENSQNYSITHSVYSGPFQLKKWYRNNKIILEKNSSFYNKENINLDFIDVSIISNENTSFQMYENEDLDFISSFLSPLTMETLGQLKKRKDVKIIPVAGFSFLTFNVNRYPFNNENLRKAFSLAVDREIIVKNITQLNEQMATRCIPPILINNESKILIENDKVDLAKIYFKKALEELNTTKDQLNITFSFGSYIIHRKEAEALKEMWEKAFNIPIKLNLMEDKIFLSKLHQHDYQIGLARLIVRYNDPMNIFERYKYKNHPKNYSNWEDEEFIRVLNLAKKEFDPIKRTQIIELAEAILIDSMPISPLYFYNNTLLKKKYVEGIYTNIVGDLLFDETILLKGR